VFPKRLWPVDVGVPKVADPKAFLVDFSWDGVDPRPLKNPPEPNAPAPGASLECPPKTEPVPHDFSAAGWPDAGEPKIDPPALWPPNAEAPPKIEAPPLAPKDPLLLPNEGVEVMLVPLPKFP